MTGTTCGLEKVDAAEGIKALILDLESTDQMETTSADMLEILREQLADATSIYIWSGCAGQCEPS